MLLLSSSCSVRFLRCGSSFVKFGPRERVDGARVAERSRALRNPLVGAKAPLSAGMRFVSEQAVVSEWLLLAEGHMYVAHGSGIIAAWCEPPAPMLGASMCPASSSRPGG